jgi:hypothetical protein
MRAALASALFAFATGAALAQPCNTSSTTLCLSSGRFEVRVAWTDFQNNTGDGQAVALTSDTGYFWFFTNTNVELVIKVLDARGVNGHFWVFYGALSNVEYEIAVRDSQTGDLQVYDNPAGQFASVGDTLAFPPPASVSRLSTESRTAARLSRPVGRPVDESQLAPAAWDSAAACTATPTALCLSGGRFRVEAAWTDFQGNHGVGQAVALTSDTGYFWFFSSTNVEAVIKVLDARPINNYFWVFYGALSNVQYTLTVTDTVTGIVKTYDNPLNLFASVGDTLAFGAPTAFQLIDGAVVKGDIEAETALLYKVYAFFGDSRLPQAYTGAPPGQLDHGIMEDVAERWSTLAPGTQQLLQPFLTPPIYASSWLGGAATAARNLERVSSDWTTIRTANSDIWYRAADAGAESAANNLAAEIETIWAKETDLMERYPRSDSDRTTNGGDGNLDIFVLPTFLAPNGHVDGKTQGVAIAYPFGSESTAPAYILIRVSAAATPEGARAVLAHEFFHVLAANTSLQQTRGSYRWLNEATATWMEDYVYPTTINNYEQLYAFNYFFTTYKQSIERASDDGYGDYLFLFYLARSSSPQVNHLIWNYVSSMSSIQAVQSAIPGGFEGSWPQFALDCWNQPSVDKFKQWDNLSNGLVDKIASPYIELTAGGGSASLPSRSVNPRAMDYAYVKVTNDAIKRIEIQNQIPVSNSGSPKVQAWIKLADGTTRVDDWTQKTRVVFCRDKASDHITDLLILYTNGTGASDGDAFVWNPGKVIYDTAGCAGYDGTVHETGHPGTGLTETIDVTASFRPTAPNQGTLTEYYAAQLTIRYYLTGQLGSCTVTMGPITRTLSFDPSSGQSSLIIDRNVSPPGYYAEGDWALQGDQTTACPSGTTTVQSAAAFQWLKIPQGQFTVANDGSLSGTYSDTLGRTWSWNFKPNQDD